MLTADELTDLAIIAARARMDRGDLAPITCGKYFPDNDPREAGWPVCRVIPWLDALNMEVAGSNPD